jgi:hypothetical protein
MKTAKIAVAEAQKEWNKRYFASPYPQKASSDVLECHEPPPTYDK